MLQTSIGNLVNSVLKTEFLKREASYQEGIGGTGEGGATLILTPARGNVDEQGSFPKYQYLPLSSDPTWNGSAVNSVLLSCVSSTPVVSSREVAQSSPGGLTVSALVLAIPKPRSEG